MLGQTFNFNGRAYNQPEIQTPFFSGFVGSRQPIIGTYSFGGGNNIPSNQAALDSAFSNTPNVPDMTIATQPMSLSQMSNWRDQLSGIPNYPNGRMDLYSTSPAVAAMQGTDVQSGLATGLTVNPANTMTTGVTPLGNMTTPSLQDQVAAMQKLNGQWTPQNTLGAIQTGVGALTALGNLYFGFKQSKIAKQKMQEDIAMQRANYKNQAKAMNAQYRDQMSGRGTTVMSGQAKRALGQMYANRKVSETY